MREGIMTNESYIVNTYYVRKFEVLDKISWPNNQKWN